MPGRFEAGTTRMVHPSPSDRRRVYLADRGCCEAGWNLGLAAVGLGGGGALVAAMVVPRGRRGDRSDELG